MANQFSAATPGTNEDELEVVRTITAEDRLAYSMETTARLLDLSYASIRREIARGKLHITRTFKLITKRELLRYLDEEEQLFRRSKK